MKKIVSAIILSILALTAAGCSRSDDNHLLIDPQYDKAEYRAEIGNLFYETEDKIGITTSFGYFLYSLKENRMISAFDIDEHKAFGEGFLAEAVLSSDGNSIYLFGYSHEETVDEYCYRYDLATGNLHKVEESIAETELHPLPVQREGALETRNWKAEDLAYYPHNETTPYYPFKNSESENIADIPVIDESKAESVWYGEGFEIPEEKINIITGVSLILDSEVTPSSYLIRNETEEVIWFGANDRIELKTAEGWKKIQAMAEAPAIGYMLEPGNEEKLWIRRDNMIDMVEGTYRVVMEFNLTETDITGKDVPGKEAYYVSSEFEIRD